MTSSNNYDMLVDLQSLLIDDDEGELDPPMATDHGAGNGTSSTEALDELAAPLLPDKPGTPEADPRPAVGSPTPPAPKKYSQQASAPLTATVVVNQVTVREQRSNARADLVVEALRGSRECVEVIRDAFANGTADFDDAVKALPQLHKVIEHVEKIEAARSVRPNLPRMMFESKNGTFTFAVLPDDDGAGTRLLDSDARNE